MAHAPNCKRLRYSESLFWKKFSLPRLENYANSRNCFKLYNCSIFLAQWLWNNFSRRTLHLHNSVRAFETKDTQTKFWKRLKKLWHLPEIFSHLSQKHFLKIFDILYLKLNLAFLFDYGLKLFNLTIRIRNFKHNCEFRGKISWHKIINWNTLFKSKSTKGPFKKYYKKLKFE